MTEVALVVVVLACFPSEVFCLLDVLTYAPPFKRTTSCSFFPLLTCACVYNLMNSAAAFSAASRLLALSICPPIKSCCCCKNYCTKYCCMLSYFCCEAVSFWEVPFEIVPPFAWIWAPTEEGPTVEFCAGSAPCLTHVA